MVLIALVRLAEVVLQLVALGVVSGVLGAPLLQQCPFPPKMRTDCMAILSTALFTVSVRGIAAIFPPLIMS